MENKKSMNIVLAVVICLALVGVLVFISINNKVNMPSNNNSVGVGSGVDNTIPIGGVAKTGDTVSMNYTGRLADGTVFDSNVDPKFNHVTPFIFTLGAGQVIKGWDEGLLGMKVGEKKTLTIPPEKGYGSQAVSTIPANSTLIFDVELVGIK